MIKQDAAGYIKTILQLGKVKISIPVALTGFLGFYRYNGEITFVLIFAIAGIFLMSMGSSAINQIQERKIDLLMKRTSGRPLPSQKISLNTAISWSLLFSLTGVVCLFLTGSETAAFIGIFTLAWYNLVYTPLKKITPFAVVPGAIIGALPPLIGWTAAGGGIFDKEILMISFFLFIGQMPHYWLLLMKIGDQFKHAGLPVITDIFSKQQLRNISFSWMFAAAISAIIFPFAGIMHNNTFSIIMISGVMIFLVTIYLLTFRGEIMVRWKQAFITENLFYLFIILILLADKFSEFYLYI